MRPKSVYVFQHIECETLGTFAAGLTARDFSADYVRFYGGESIPEDWHTANALIFLGGPMSVNDEASYPYLAAEKAIIRSALRQRIPVLGVCLGSQLLAAAAGSRVFPGTRPEIGWQPISLTTEGKRDALLRNLEHLSAVFHWHGETFDLPHGAIRLASSPVTPNQAFCLGGNAYGLQFHVEVDAPMIDAWVQAYPHDLGPDADAAAQRIAADTAVHLNALQLAATELMDRFVAVVDSADRC